MSEHKCVPRDMTLEMFEAVLESNAGPDADATVRLEWQAAYDAAPARECEAERLLRELVTAADDHDDDPQNATAADKSYFAWQAARAYLGRKP